MRKRIAELLSRTLNLPLEHSELYVQRVLVGIASMAFVLCSMIIVAFDDVFFDFNALNTLSVGDVAPRVIVAPTTARPFTSEILTQEARLAAREGVQIRYYPPDPNVARQQTQLTQQIVDFINNVRADVYATQEQKAEDIRQITALTLDDNNINALLRVDDETWTAIANETLSVLQRIMRETIRPNQIDSLRDQLTIQVSVRFNPQERDIIVGMLEDLIRPNTFENPEATEVARQEASDAIQPLQRTFVRGETIVNEGDTITAADYEAIRALGLLRSEDRRFVDMGRAAVASIVVLVLVGLYLLRFSPQLLLDNTPMLTLVAVIFLLMLVGARFLGISGNIYLFPWALMAMLLTAIAGAPVAFITSLGLAFLTGLMANNSLEVASLITAGSLIGILGLRRVDRLNTFFTAGAIVGATNAAIVGVFILSDPTPLAGRTQTVENLLLALISGALILPTTVFAMLYIVTQMFNLPTVIKLLDLAQPSKPLLQRLLREAPGTYQHSLQVANLAEQAAHAIGADAQMTHVAALYHDIGKMNNPLYFTENQQDIGNPHDVLNDPHRSADIIISHVTDGDEMARQYRLPNRIRDFIREHHGTTQVFVFYQQALNRVDGDANSIDIEDFSNPGPKPQSKETAILMLADSCEAAVRSVKPNSKAGITELISKIFNQKRDEGQLDDSGLTLKELQIIQQTFVEILLGMFHPRINYQEAVKRPASKTNATSPTKSTGTQKAVGTASSATNKTVTTKAVNGHEVKASTDTKPSKQATASSNKRLNVELSDFKDDDDMPLSEVPRLTRTEERKADKETPQKPKEAPGDDEGKTDDVEADEKKSS